jgi:hypothetical protein
LAALEAAATKGPWRCWDGSDAHGDLVTVQRIGPEGAGIYAGGIWAEEWDLVTTEKDAEFIAVARAALPDLLADRATQAAEVERLQGELTNLQACYQDRAEDVDFEYNRANAAEQQVDRLTAQLLAIGESPDTPDKGE